MIYDGYTLSIAVPESTDSDIKAAIKTLKEILLERQRKRAAKKYLAQKAKAQEVTV